MRAPVRSIALAALLLWMAPAAFAQVTAKRHMIVTGHPLASQAGLQVLDRGGSAVDAAIAAQLVLGLVEPHASGIGGGAFFLHFDGLAKRVTAIDGRETAPAGAGPDLFMADGKPIPFASAVVGGRSVGVPGTPRLLEVMHARHGRLPWAALFEPAITIAEQGFPISSRLHLLVSRDAALAKEPATRAYFFGVDGKALAAGAVIRNPAYAATLRALAKGGADAFYTGAIAQEIVAAVRGHANPGTLSLEDLAGYRVRDVEPICMPYRAYRLCGMPPSSSGGVAVLQIMGILGELNIQQHKPGSPGALHRLAEAGRLAFADRNRYLGDDRFVSVPTAGLVDLGYVASRGRLIRPDRAMEKAEAGVPAGVKVAYADDPEHEVVGTTHLAVVDAQGNAVSLTSTIEGFFGSKQMVRGFLLNNELTDFDFRPEVDGRLSANSVAPGKRPRSSMAPFVVLDGKGARVEQVLGSPGGSFIINYVAKTLVGTIDWGLSMQEAIDLPNAGNRGGPTEIEKGTAWEAAAPALKLMGHDVRVIEMASGLAGIRRTQAGWEGVADKRREGVALGR